MATLNFKGKSAVWNHHLSVPYHTLEKDAKKSLKGENDDENLIIEGDNLLALKALLPQYQGKVKCIYIDPPYNTGNEGWVYSDNVSSPTIKEWVGEIVGKEGEDLTRHDKWLCMMTPRLKMLRELLADEGVIFISIDDNEQHRLRSLVDEIFGIENFVADFIWHHRKSSQNDIDVSLSHNYTLCYARNRAGFSLNPLAIDEAKFSNPDNDPRGDWVADPMDAPAIRENLMYPIINPNTKETFLPPTGRHWRFSKEKYEEAVKDGRILFGKTGKSRPQFKRYKSEAEEKGTNVFTIWDDVGTATDATKELMDIFDGQKVFDTPKPVSLIKKILKLSTDPESIILDSFAGSGTTGHAVLELNKEDGGNRKFILVEMEDYANTTTAERVRRSVKKFELNGGFTYNTLGGAIDAENLLAGKLPSYKEFAKYVYYLGTGKNHPDEAKIKEQDALVGKGENETIYLLYKPSMEALKTLAITLDWAQEAQKKDKGRKIVYAPACYLDDETLDQFGIKFVSIPYNLFERAV
ncbi:MAG: site-specific DNA-methyltransferase [Patescibacteria group bacterium]